MTQNNVQTVSIVGAGVTGIACAHQLRTNGFGGAISVFDKEGASGGRLVSKRNSTGDFIYEMGAGRFNEREHPHVRDICRDFNLAVERFSYQATYHQSGASVVTSAPAQLLAHIMTVAPRYFGQNKYFHEFCAEHLEPGALELLTTLSGYNTLTHPKLPVEGALGILLRHPETHSLFNGNMDGWYYIKDGFQQITEKLWDEVDETVDFRNKAELQKISRNKNGKYILSFKTKGIDLITITDAVIMATPLQDAYAIEGMDVLIEGKLQADLQEVPLVKGFIQFDRPWWNDHGYKNNCVISDTPIRKLYLNDQHNVAWFYCDGQSALELGKLLQGSDEKVIMRLIINHLETPVPLANVIDYEHKFWQRGISFNAHPDTGKTVRDFAAVAPNLLLCSDVLTDHLGWIEGGLISAHSAVQHLLTNNNTNLVFNKGVENVCTYG